MPLVAHTQLPTYNNLRRNGHEVIPLERALKQDIRELHIGLLNMMPDAALRVTEQQYMRLIGNCNQIVQFYVHPFTIPGLSRSRRCRTSSLTPPSPQSFGTCLSGTLRYRL